MAIFIFHLKWKNVQKSVKIIVMGVSHGMTEFLLELLWLGREEKAMDIVKPEELFINLVSWLFLD